MASQGIILQQRCVFLGCFEGRDHEVDVLSGASAFNSDVSVLDRMRGQDQRRRGPYVLWGIILPQRCTSSWDVSRVETMRLMFYGASSFNSDVSSWDVSRVETMRSMFYGAHPSTAMCLRGCRGSRPWVMLWGIILQQRCVFLGCFEGRDHDAMFSGASSFNSDVSSWIVSRVETMAYTFYGASSFNSDVSSWDVSREPYDMYGASSFNSVCRLGMFRGSRPWRRRSTGRHPSTAMCRLGMLIVSRVEPWRRMFLSSGASSFNSDVSSWDVSRSRP